MAQAFSEHLSGAAGLCWYASSRLHSPLLVGQRAGQCRTRRRAACSAVIGAKEAKVEGGSFPVEDRVDGQTRRWTRQVSSNFGAYPASQADNPDSISGRAFPHRHGAPWPDPAVLPRRPVARQLDTLDKRYPPLAEVKDALVPAHGAAAALRTAATETLDSLPQDMEPVFRNAADTYLMPRLKTLAGAAAPLACLPEARPTHRGNGCRWNGGRCA